MSHVECGTLIDELAIREARKRIEASILAGGVPTNISTMNAKFDQCGSMGLPVQKEAPKVFAAALMPLLIYQFSCTESTSITSLSLNANDVQQISSEYKGLCEDPAGKLLSKISSLGNRVIPQLICEAEFTKFSAEQRTRLLSLLWKYINDHRTSNNHGELIAVGSAIRKYIANMPLERVGDIAVLLAPANNEPLSLKSQIEVAKMIYRQFEANPPVHSNIHPELANCLLRMARAYTNPFVLLRDEYSAVASLSIEALVSMRSDDALSAWRLATESQYKWFGRMVTNNLSILQKRWSTRSDEAAKWLNNLKSQVVDAAGKQDAERA